MVRAHVIFSGAVQGVGFRYTARAFASTLKLTGWVKNLTDGRVELVCEGPREQVENLLYKLDQYYQADIKHKDIDWLKAKKSFSDFVVAY
ncbi:MAG: acylphosphatase [Candidatus Omnitrophica bacterium]|nr:acylphosphatase [Candidatus Omnitrophota bacterium]